MEDIPAGKLQDIYEQTRLNKKGLPLTWGATPLAYSPAIMAQQRTVKQEIQKLFDLRHRPTNISPEVADYIIDLNLARTIRREIKNTDSYIYRGNDQLTQPEFTKFDELVERALMGQAAPAELLFLAHILQIPTIELASLTHPYSQRIELLEEMRSAVEEAVYIMDGTITPSGDVTYAIKGSDNPHRPDAIRALHMTRKRSIGNTNDQTNVMERSSFVVLVDKLDLSVAAAIRAVPYQDNPNWSTRVFKASKLQHVVPQLLAENHYDIAIPVSTTVVAINNELQRQLMTEAAKASKRKRYLASYSLTSLQ